MKNNIAEVFEKYRRKLLAFISDRVPEEEDAKDILQDVFLSLIQTEETTSVMQISGWLYQVARNNIIDRSRKQKEDRIPQSAIRKGEDTFVYEVTEILADENQAPDKEYLKALVWEELAQALDELPSEQRLVFEQTELNGVSFKDLSAQTGVSVKTLLSRKHYAVKHLRKRLKEVYEALLYDD